MRRIDAPRILIVDDNVLNVELVNFIMGRHSCQFESAPDAAHALCRIEEFRPDLILMDVQMPGMDGLELTRHIKSNPATKDILVIAFTAYAMKGDDARMRAVGCDGFIAKPIDVATFAQTVFSFLGAR